MRALLTALLIVACSKEDPTPVVEPTPPTPAAPVVEAEPPSPPAKAVDWDARVREVVQRGRARQKCNDLTGCPMVSSLAVLGAKAAPALARLYEETGGDDFWRIQLLEALGRIGAPESAPFLIEVARTDELPPARVEALLALAVLGRPEHRPAIEALVSELDPARDRGVLLAAGYAIAALGGEDRGKTLIREHLVVPEKTVRWDLLRPGVYAAGQLRLTELRPRVEEIAQRADPFVRREAVRALEAMRDRAAIPTLIRALEDPVPGVRDAALRSLKTLTGARHRETFEQWSRWWEREQKKNGAETPVPARKN